MLALDSTSKRTPGFDTKWLHLLKVAARVFSEVGYGSASMRRIAAEIQLSLAGIYHYVTSKEELLYWIQYRTFDSLLQDLNSSLEGIVEPKQRLADRDTGGRVVTGGMSSTSTTSRRTRDCITKGCGKEGK